jgi:uncharacterized protein YeaO (DUF488 family)
MIGKVHTRRWNDPAEPGDGTRVLVTRYRPRGVSKAKETWDEWWPQLGPSVELHADAYGKHGRDPIDFAEYRQRYLAEMAQDPGRFFLRAMVERVAGGETLTLLCSSACVDENHCHRSVLREHILAGAQRRK